MLLSAFFFCLMTVFVKLAGEIIATIHIVFFRAVFTFIITIIMIKKIDIPPFGKNKKLLLVRGVIGSIALFFVYESINRLSLSQATIIQYLYPIFTSILAIIIISEKFNRTIIYASLIGFFGIYITLGIPSLKEVLGDSLSNLTIALAGSFLTGLAYVTVRKANNENEHPYVIMFYFPLLTIPMSLPFLINNWPIINLYTAVLLIFIGICTQLGQLFLTYGYKYLPASKAATISYVQVPIAVILGSIIFEEQINTLLIIGSLIVLFAILLTVSSKRKIVTNP